MGNVNSIFSLIYRMLQNKLVHVQYTSKKAMSLHDRMIHVSDINERHTQSLTVLINKTYSLRTKIKNKTGDEGEGIKHEKYFVSICDGLIKENEKILDSLSLLTKEMRFSAHSLQITVLKALHYQWREQVYMSVLEEDGPFPHCDDRRCALGKWYYSEGQKKFGLLPVFIRLGEVHSKFHQAATAVNEEYRRKELSTDSLLKKLEHMETLSLAVIAALDELDNNILGIM